MKRPLLLAITLALLLSPLHAAAQQPLPAQTEDAVTYDTFMLLALDDRVAQFPLLTAQAKADIMREQMLRWRRINGARLTPDQMFVLAELTTLAQPGLYDSSNPQQPQLVAAVRDAEQRMRAAFTRPEAQEAFSWRGPYLPVQ